MFRLIQLAFFSFFLSMTSAHAATCLDGFELTAIVVMENDIKQSVEAYSCRIESVDHIQTYEFYNKLRSSWKQERAAERAKRDEVYQRIYGDNWQDKIVEWEMITAKREGKLFKPGELACYDLRMEILEHTGNWKNLYDDAAEKAAGAVYDPLRCTPLL